MMISKEFKKVLKKGTIQDRIMVIVYVVLFIFVFIAYTVDLILNPDEPQSFGMLIALFIVFGIVYLFNRDKFKGLKYWTEIFEDHPEELVWIKPIETSHTVALVLTVNTSYKYELFLENGSKLILETAKERIPEFYKGIRIHAPHAHFGYSREIKKLYKKDKKNFLKNAKEKGLFRSISDYSL